MIAIRFAGRLGVTCVSALVWMACVPPTAEAAAPCLLVIATTGTLWAGIAALATPRKDHHA